MPRKKVPGGYVGLVLVTLGPLAILPWRSTARSTTRAGRRIWLALAAIVVGALLYFPIRRFIKPGIPDIDPYQSGGAAYGSEA